MLTFKHPHPPAGRILAYSAEMMVGTIQPATKPVQWVMDAPGHKVSGTGNTVNAAKQRLNDAFTDWMRRAGLGRAA